MNGMEFLEKYGKNLSDEQRAAILSDTSTVVSAGAGSGKTTVLSLRFARLVIDGKAHADEILTITFTRKAAAEMYERIHMLLEKAAESDERMRNELDERFPKARISTMDSFWSEIARTDSLRYGITRDFANLESDDERDMVKRLYEKLQDCDECREGFMTLSELYSSDAILTFLIRIAGMTDILTEFSAEKNTSSYETFLSLIERDAVNEGHSVFNTLIALDDADPDNGEHENIAKMVSFFESGEYGKLIDFDYKNLRKKKDKELWTFIKEEYRPLAAKLRAISNMQNTVESAADVSALLEVFIRNVQEEKRRMGVLSFHDTEALCRRILLENDDVREWYQRKFRYIMVDEFQDNNGSQRDLLFLLSSKSGITGGHVPSPDELEKDKLFFVGDDKQSIYYFRGADVSVFRALKEDIQSIGGKVLSLSANYRSEPGLINHFNNVFKAVFDVTPDENEIKREKLISEYTGIPYTSFYAEHEEIKAREAYEGVEPKIRTYMIPKSDEDLSGYASEADSEAYFIAKLIQQMVFSDEYLIPDGKNGLKRPDYSDIAILLRTTLPQMPIEKAFRINGIPYTVAESSSALMEAVGSDIFSFLTLLVYPDDKGAYLALLRSPFARLSDDAVLAFSALDGNAFSEEPELSDEDMVAFRNLRDLYHSLLEMAGRRPITRILERMFYESGYYTFLQSSDYLSAYTEHFDYIWAAASLYDNKNASLPLFLDYLRPMVGKAEKIQNAVIQHIGESGVQIMTIHRSKGLQFPIVILADSAHGASNKSKSDRFISIDGSNPLILPSLSDGDDVIQSEMCEYSSRREKAEARRLLYVALTRAVDHLVLTGYERKNGMSGSLYSIYMEGNDGNVEEIERIPDVYEGYDSASARHSFDWYDAPVSLEAVYNEKRFGVKDASHKETGWARSEDAEELPSLATDTIIAEHGIYQEFGVMVHSMLEAAVSGRTYIPSYPPVLSEEERKVISETLGEIEKAFFSSAFYKKHIKDHRTLAEVRFYYPAGNSVAEGSADLLVFGDDYYLVVDYKTDRYKDEGMHKGQITAYAEAMEDLYKKKCLAVLLYIRGMTEGTFLDKNGDEVKGL